MTHSRNFIIDELTMFDEHKQTDFQSMSDTELNSTFTEHCNKYAVEVKAKDLVDNYQDVDFLMESPDGYLNVGNFWIKSNKSIITIKTVNYKASVSTDHLFETPTGWVKAGLLKKGDLILTKSGFEAITYSNIWDKSDSVYDWEILHENHRYWAGNGLSSHNTGKTYLLLNALREAQKLGYYVIFYDSENAVDKELAVKFGIDPEKFRYEPCNTVQEFRTSVTNIIDTLIEQKNKGFKIPKIIIALDSAGNLATQKEVEDAKTGSEKSDMTRAKILKSIFRIIMTKLAVIKAPFVFTNHVYGSMDLFSQTIQGGGCIVPGTKIIMADDSYKNIEDIKVGDSIKTLLGSNKIEKTWTFNKPTIKFEFDNNSELTCSTDHRFFTCQIDTDPLNDENWITADELQINESVKLISNSGLIETKVITKTALDNQDVHDLTVAEAQHYITENGIINHNSGPEYAASVILFLSKAKLKDGTNQTGIIVTAKPNKNRFVKPTAIKFHISFDKGMNPYIGLQDYISWDSCGIQRGKFITESAYNKLKPAEQEECRIHTFTKDDKEITQWFQPSETARKLCVRHLNDTVELNELFTSKVLNEDILRELDEIVSKEFKYGVEDLNLDGILDNISIKDDEDDDAE